MFLNIKTNICKGNILSIPDTNLAYIEPHKLKINDITYLFFNECEEVYINTLEKSIPLNKLENYIKTHKPEKAVRFSKLGYRSNDTFIDIPLYLANRVKELI